MFFNLLLVIIGIGAVVLGGNWVTEGAVALFIVADDKIIDNTPDNIINRTDGLLLLFIFTFYMTHVLKGTSRHALHHAPAPAPDQAQPSSSHPSTHPLLHSAQSPHSSNPLRLHP